MKGLSNFGDVLGDYAEFGTVAADVALESVPQMLVPGGITAQITRGAAKKFGQNKAKTEMAKESTRKEVLAKFAPENIIPVVAGKKAASREAIKETDRINKIARDKYLGSDAGKKALKETTDSIAEAGTAKWLASAAPCHPASFK